MDRAQSVDDKNGVICLVTLTPRAIVFKISEITNFIYFLLKTAKKLSQFGQFI